MLRGAISRPIAVAMLFLALVLIGAISYKQLPVDLLPSIVYPRLTVVTTYEDIPAEDLERLVTQPMEEVVTALSGVRRVVSRTREGVSMITIEYEWGTQMDFANLHLREAIDRVAFRDDFPQDADRPLILRWDPTSRPISILVLQGEGDVEDLTDFAREVVKPALEQVDGVSQAEVVGGADREILVEPNLSKMAIYGVDIEDIRVALASSNISFPGGKIKQGPLELSLRIAGEYENLDEIRRTDIPRMNQSTIKIGDVATVTETVKELEGMTLLGDESVVSMLLYKEPEANTIKVSEEIDIALGVVAEDYGGFDYSFVYRDAEYVRASFNGLRDSLKYGAVLAFLVLLFFLRDLRSTIVVGLSIPVSLTTACALLYFGGVKLNLMSLGGLSLASGMLVDNAIVVLENITRHMNERLEKAGGKLGDLQLRNLIADVSATGTLEVARPVVAATLTTVAVFFPVVYVPGIAGAFFRDQALSVTFALVISVATALVLQPVLSARVLRPSTGFAVINKILSPLLTGFRWVFDRIYTVYHRSLERVLPHRVPMLLALTLGLVACFFIAQNLQRSFMPQRTSGDLRVDLELPAGTPLEETIDAVSRIAIALENEEQVRTVFAQVGRTERTLAAMQDFASSNTAKIRIFIEPGRHAYREGQHVQENLTRLLETLPEAQFTFREEGIGLAELISTGEAAFTLGVLAEDPIIAVQAAERIREATQDVEGLTDLQVDRVLGTPNMVVALDREEILRSGLEPDVIARELRNRIAGVEATTFNEIEQRIDIAVRLPEDQRRDLPTALASPVEVAGGKTVPLRSFLRVNEERPVRELLRRNQRRMVTISGNVTGRSVSDVWNDVFARIDQLELEDNISLVQAGEDVAIRKSFQDLMWAMLLAGLLVYMILAAQFESFLDPLLIASVIPIGLAGSTIAIALTHGSVNILSLIGVVALLGIAVNDAIVKIDTIRRLRVDGMSGRAAVLEASRLRFRPILMTSATTVLAMVPMAIGLGSGEQLQRPLAITIIGGLSLTTLVTLFYTPILYEIAHRIPRREHAPAETDPELAT